MPNSGSGKWSVGLILAMFLLFTIGMSFATGLYDSVPAGGTILADISQRPALELSMLAGYGAGIGAFVTGLIAIIRDKERKLMVYLSTLVGGALLLSLLGEILFPH